MKVMAKVFLVVFLLVALSNGQEDLDQLKWRVEQKRVIQELGEDGAQEMLLAAQNVVTSLLDLLRGPLANDGDPGVPGGSCLQAIWNLTGISDPSGLPVLVDLIDAFGKIQPGK